MAAQESERKGEWGPSYEAYKYLLNTLTAKHPQYKEITREFERVRPFAAPYYKQIQDWEKAYSVYKEIGQEPQEILYTGLKLGLLYESRNEWREAKNVYTELFRSNRGNPEVISGFKRSRVELGKTLTKSGKWEEAMKRL